MSSCIHRQSGSAGWGCEQAQHFTLSQASHQDKELTAVARTRINSESEDAQPIAAMVGMHNRRPCMRRDTRCMRSGDTWCTARCGMSTGEQSRFHTRGRRRCRCPPSSRRPCRLARGIRRPRSQNNNCRQAARHKLRSAGSRCGSPCLGRCRVHSLGTPAPGSPCTRHGSANNPGTLASCSPNTVWRSA